jgi:hypothetical protein
MIMPFIIPTTLTLKQLANLLRQMRCQWRVELVFLKIELQLVLLYERVYNGIMAQTHQATKSTA